MAHLFVSLALDFDAGSEGIAAVGIAEVVIAAVGNLGGGK
jgi:hypothetical protein